jgi:hypothetical protein
MIQGVDTVLKYSGLSDDVIKDNGNVFSNTISTISKGNFVPEKKKYPQFRTTFWEESQFNPSIANTSQSYEYEAHIGEETSHWSAKGHIWDTQKRWVEPRPQNETGPIKRTEYLHFFENGQKYFGRNRQLLPYVRAKVYTRPLDRRDEEIVEVFVSE